MRKIKLRAYDNVANKMYYGKQEQFDDMLGFRFEHFQTENPIYTQYIGMHDKNNKEIYEDDIVKKVYYNGQETKRFFVVEYDEVNFRFMIIDQQYNFKDGISKLRNYEIIGNIYENPELINERV